MKFLLPLMIVAMLAGGCIFRKAKPAVTPAAAPPQPIVTPDNSLTAKVVLFNSDQRFVVLNFPVGQMPKMGQSFFLYRNNLKVGEVKITGPRMDDNIVADLVTGDAQSGDDVRDQ